MIDSGALVVHGLVHRSVFGLEANAHVFIGYTGAAESVARQIAEEPDVALVSLVAGHRPIVAEIRTRDRTTLKHVLERLGATDRVTSTETSLYLEVLKGANREINRDRAPPRRTR